MHRAVQNWTQRSTVCRWFSEVETIEIGAILTTLLQKLGSFFRVHNVYNDDAFKNLQVLVNDTEAAGINYTQLCVLTQELFLEAIACSGAILRVCTKMLLDVFTVQSMHKRDTGHRRRLSVRLSVCDLWVLYRNC